MKDASFLSSARDRVRWLGRMPTHWRLLLGSQLLFTIYAVRWRQRLVENRRDELLREGELEQVDERTGSNAR